MQVDKMNAFGFMHPSQPESVLPVEDQYTEAVDMLYQVKHEQIQTRSGSTPKVNVRGMYSNPYVNTATAKKYGPYGGSSHFIVTDIQVIFPDLFKYYIRHHRYMFSSEQLELLLQTVKRLQDPAYNAQFVRTALSSANDGRVYVRLAGYENDIEDYSHCIENTIGIEGFSEEIVDELSSHVFKVLPEAPTAEIWHTEETAGVKIDFYS